MTKRFGAVTAVDGVSLSIAEGELVGLIGPNGSGKTTLFNCISGFLNPTSGDVIWDGQKITGWAPNRVCRNGLARTFQQPMLFASMTVLQNVEIAANARRRSDSGRRSNSLPRGPADILEFCGLGDIAAAHAASLSYGNRRRLGVAIALASHPRLLLLDEPAAGLNNDESAELAALLRATCEAEVTIVVIDHDMPFLMPIVRRVSVFDAGRLVVTGTPDEIQRNPEVIRIYLGERFAQAQDGLPKSNGGPS